MRDRLSTASLHIRKLRHKSSQSWIAFLVCLLNLFAWMFMRGMQVLLCLSSCVFLGGRTPLYADLQNLPYLNQVVKEVLRLYPAIPIFPRYLVSAWFQYHLHLPVELCFYVVSMLAVFLKLSMLFSERQKQMLCSQAVMKLWQVMWCSCLLMRSVGHLSSGTTHPSSYR
jgi:Cytochrome P450